MKNHTAQTLCKFCYRVCLPTVTLYSKPMVRKQIPIPFPLCSPILSTGSFVLGRRTTSLQLHCRVLRSTGRAVTLAAEDHWQGMMGSSQQAGWCKKPTSPINERTALKVVRKTIYTIIMLTITVVTGATGTSDSTLVPTVSQGQRRKRQGIRVMFTQFFFGKEKIQGKGSLQIAEGTF